jgi:peptide/nickel transport system substrate-binding protein
MTLAYNTGSTQRQTIGQILQAELSAINENFIIEVTGLPWPTFLRNSRARKFPIFTQAWLEDIHETHNWVVPYTVGTFGDRQGLPEDLLAQFQEIINRGVVEPDPAKRAEIYKEFNQLYYEQVPCLLLYNAQGRRYQQRWVSGWYFNPVYPGRYYYSLSKE